MRTVATEMIHRGTDLSECACVLNDMRDHRRAKWWRPFYGKVEIKFQVDGAPIRVDGSGLVHFPLYAQVPCGAHVDHLTLVPYLFRL